MLAAAPAIARELPGLLSLECWGGATFDVALRFLHENPWEPPRAAARARSRTSACRCCCAGATCSPTTASTRASCARSSPRRSRAGIDIIRIFDALNDIEGMRSAIEAALRDAGAVEGALCYTGDLADPAERTYTLDYYLRLAEQLVERRRARARDQGHGRPAARPRRGHAGRGAARALRRAGAPAHPRHRRRLARHLPGGRRGRRRRARRRRRAARRDDQPAVAVGDRRGARGHAERDPRSSLDARSRSSPTGRRCAALYAPFEAGLRAPTGRVYRHQIPGGQLSNLRQQAAAIGVGDRFEEVEAAYERANAPARRHHQGDPDEQGRRRPRDLRRLRRHRPRRARGATRALRPARLGARLPARRTRPARRTASRSRSPTRALAGRPRPRRRRALDARDCSRRSRSRARAPGARSRRSCSPGPYADFQAAQRAPRRRRRCCRPPRSSTACARTRRCPSTSPRACA